MVCRSATPPSDREVKDMTFIKYASAAATLTKQMAI